MSTLPPISLYRVSNGQLSTIPRWDAEDAGIKAIEPMLTPGRHRIPHTDAWEVETIIVGSTLIATIHSPPRPVIRMWVVLDGHDLALAVPPPHVLDIALPACIVEVFESLPYDPCVGWLRDLEGTLACAWVSSRIPP